MKGRPQVLLGVSGGIAAYKSAEIVRRLVEREVEVRVAMTRAAQEFVAPLTFAVLSGHEVYLDVFGSGNSPRMDHIELADWTDVLLVAPATAHTIARLANGLADDFLTTYALVHRGPNLIAPAMETRMWEHPATRRNLELLAARGARFVGPATGFLASGRDGSGRMAEPAEIVEAALALASSARRDLEGLRVLVTAGPTRERLDPVRFVSNRSSGRMGYALAEAAYERGAEVILVSGPTELPLPTGVMTHRVETTNEMQRAVATLVKRADLLLMAAAPADYRPTQPAPAKRPRANGRFTVELEATPDILGSLERRQDLVVVGFALETGGDGVAKARKKLQDKGLDFVILNDALEPGAGFEVATNRVTIIGKRGDPLSLPLLSKRDVAEQILDAVEQALT